MSTSIGSLVGGVSKALRPPSELRVYVALATPEDCELALGMGVCTSFSGDDEAGFSFSRVLTLGLCGVASTARFGFSTGVAFAPSFLPKKDVRLFCFILEASFVSEEDMVIVSQGNSHECDNGDNGVSRRRGARQLYAVVLFAPICSHSA